MDYLISRGNYEREASDMSPPGCRCFAGHFHRSGYPGPARPFDIRITAAALRIPFEGIQSSSGTASAFPSIRGEHSLSSRGLQSHPLPEMLATSPPPVRMAPGELLLKFRATSRTFQSRTGSGELSYLSNDLEKMQSDLGIRRIRPVFSLNLQARPQESGNPRLEAEEQRTERGRREGLQRWYLAGIDSDADPQETARRLMANPEIEMAEPVYEYRLAGQNGPQAGGLPDGTTDPRITNQWHHTYSKTWQAWQYLKDQGRNPGGSRDVVVAVIDTGVDYTTKNSWATCGPTAPKFPTTASTTTMTDSWMMSMA